MNHDLLTIAAYARRVGVNPSTISRAVRKGALPSVEFAGRRLIDPVAADAARRDNSAIAAGHGGKPDRAVRRRAVWKARRSTGYDPGQDSLLQTMQSQWPELVQRTMAILGASEMDQARAVLTVRELVGYACWGLYQRLDDYRQHFDAEPELMWSPKVSQWLADLGGEYSEKGWSGSEQALTGSAGIVSDMLDAALSASPAAQ